MKVNVMDISNAKVGELNLPAQFKEEFRPDIIHRAVLALQSNAMQPYGAAPEAGKRVSAKLSRRRRKFKTSYGIGISRVPRKIMSRSGTRFNWVGALAPGTVGGRQAHPPKPSKILQKKINIKERLKAIRSAIAATMDREIISARGHKIPKEFPFVVENKIEGLSKTKEVTNVLEKLGFSDEISRTEKRKIRAGKGRLRGRRYQSKKSLLIVISKDSKIMQSASNIQGVDIVNVRNLNAELLAPGAKPGRVTLWTKGAVELLGKENLFEQK